MPDLETVDIEGVEILGVGGPYRGVGSPPEGDWYTTDDLKAMAAAAAELGSELDAPNKIGHSDAQALLMNSGFPVTPGEMPRIGTLTNQRVSDDGQKLLTDLRGVPKKVADLISAGAWTKRSAELSRVTSQKTGTVHDWVVTGLAWLGAKMPAVQTLDDVVALYEADGVELRRLVLYEEGAVVWDPGQSYQALRDSVAEALNGPPTGGMNSPRFWVRDVDVAGSRALVEDYENEASLEAWVIGFSRGTDGTISIATSSDWTKAEQAWVETARGLEAQFVPASREAPADTAPVPTFTEEQRKTFAEATGLEGDKVTDEMLHAAGVAETEEPKPEDEPKPEGGGDDAERSLESALTMARSAEARSVRLESELATEKRRSFVEAAMKDGKIAPGQKDTLEALFDANPDAARKFVDDAPVNEELVRTFGSDETGEEADAEAADRAYAADAAQRLGIPIESVV